MANTHGSSGSPRRLRDLNMSDDGKLLRETGASSLRCPHVVHGGSDPRCTSQDRSRPHAADFAGAEGRESGGPFSVTEFLKPGIEEMCQAPLPLPLSASLRWPTSATGWIVCMSAMYADDAQYRLYLYRTLAKMRRCAASCIAIRKSRH